jgi:hypothetical protein
MEIKNHIASDYLLSPLFKIDEASLGLEASFHIIFAVTTKQAA